MNVNVKKIARIGIVSALYVALTLPVMSLASGAIQFRPSEALTILPLIFPETVVALTIGCVISNLITGCAVMDIVLGGLITAVAGLITSVVGKYIKGKIAFLIGGIPPVILNAFLLPLVWYFCYGKLESLYVINVLILILTQAVSVYLLGGIVYFSTTRLINKGILLK